MINLTPHALIFTLAAIGISETVYLIRKRIAAEKPICPIGGDCNTVLTSKYSKMFLIPTDVLGLMFYIVVMLISALLVIGTDSIPFITLPLLDLALKVMVAAGSLMSLFLAYLQWKVLNMWCFWCLMSAFTIWLMGIILLISKLI